MPALVLGTARVKQSRRIMKRLEAKEGKCLRSRCERLGDKPGGRFHSVDIPGALMKDFRGVASAVTWLGRLPERREASTACACAHKTVR